MSAAIAVSLGPPATEPTDPARPDVSARRWQTLDETTTVVVREFDALPPAQDWPAGDAGSPGYLAVQLSGPAAEAPARAGGLYIIAMNVDPSFDAEFHQWYDEEHLPRLSAVPGVLLAKRYRTVAGPRAYLAVYHLQAPGVVGTPPWLAASETPWTHRARSRMSDRQRLVCRPLPSSQPSPAEVPGVLS